MGLSNIIYNFRKEKVNPTRIERMTLRKQAETGISRSTTELRVLFQLCSVMAIIITCLDVFAT